MAKPIVAIVGRPNVGKSTLFNRLAGKRIAITEDTPGVTRDRIYAEGEWLDNYFTLIDTGGIEPNSTDTILRQMRRQAEIAIDMANLILFIVDGKEGMTSADREVAQMLRLSNKNVIIICNKMDKHIDENNIFEFYNLGLGDPFPISSTEALNIGDLCDLIVENIKDFDLEESDEDAIKIAVIGKPNAGKSSLINKVIGEERVIVSDIAGTTRDAIDTKFERNGQKYIIIDTAGIRRKAKINEAVEKYSVVRAFAAVERANICIMMIDAQDGVTEQDTRIAGYAHENGCAVIIVINKWDLIEKSTNTHIKYTNKVRNDLAYMTYAPILTISALTGKRVDKLLETIDTVYEHSTRKISTGVLNDIISEAVLMNPPRTDKGRKLKILYATQTGVQPPKFLVFCNDEKLVHFSYCRYLENKLRESFEFIGSPISIEFRNRKGE